MMTTLRVEWETGRIRKLSVSGHAGFAPMGSDIVCAAVSILMTTCVNALESVAGVAPLVERRERDAFMALTMPEVVGGQDLEAAQIVLRTGLQGFEDLSSAHPKHFRIIDGRKSSC